MDPNLDPSVELVKEKIVCEEDPYTLLRLGYLYIKTKSRELLPLKPNKSQQMVLDRIRKRRIAKKPIRVCVLKGRQFGISTLIEAIIFSCASQKANTNALILSDDEKGSQYLFEMCKLYDEELRRREPHLSPQIKYSNEMKLEYFQKRSTVLIDTAKNKDAGRKYTFHLAHLSECARYKTFLETLVSLLQGVPDLPETAVFMETTAAGENEFCEWWRQKETEQENGESDWELIFLSWKDHDEYQRKFVNEAERHYFMQTMTPLEKDVMSKHGLTLEQMNWRRRTIKDKCAGKLHKFHEEYPLTAEEAFITSGKRVFPDDIVRPHEKTLLEPKYVGDIYMTENRPQFVPNSQGYLKIWKMPSRGHQYVIASDSSDGLTGGDPAAAVVLDRTTWEQVAVLRGAIVPDLFGDMLFSLGLWYNVALLIPEVNNQGLVTVIRLRDLAYPRISTHERFAIDPNSGVADTTMELGWKTTEKSKPVIINDLSGALREILLVIHDKNTYKEVCHYSVLPDGKYGGTGGYHDDLVITLAIAVHYAKKIPENTYQQEQSIPANLSQKRTGY